MFRSTLIAAGALLLCSSAYSQQRIDPSRIYPITAPIQDAGTLNWATKTWTPPNASPHLKLGKVTVFNNTCTWTGGGYYGGFESCEDNYDEGRIPSPTSPSAPIGATTDNNIGRFQFGYCTTALTGTVVQKIGFFDNAGGRCVGLTPPTPPPISTTATAFFDFTGAGLPGSTSTTVLACWLVTVGFSNTPFCLQSDGNGVWDNNIDADMFNWSWQHENATTVPTAPNGLFINGEPSTSPVSGCTYNIPCGTDALYGNPCGSGLDTFDASWINVDGVAPGDTTSGLCLGGIAPLGGTNCYFFGGYPGNPLASYWLVLDSLGACAGCTGNIFNYCTSKTNSSGCVPTINASGTPSTGRNTSPFNLFTNQALPGKAGLLFYSKVGPGGSAFQGGHLCATPPTKRTPLQTSTATGSPPCTGVFSFNMNNQIQLGLDPALIYGQQVWAQWWTRDAGVPSGTSLTNGLSFTICL